jgi:hypothetical protein
VIPWKELSRPMRAALGLLAAMLALLFFGGIVLVMTADSWGQTINGYCAFLFSILLVWALAPAFKR